MLPRRASCLQLKQAGQHPPPQQQLLHTQRVLRTVAAARDLHKRVNLKPTASSKREGEAYLSCGEGQRSVAVNNTTTLDNVVAMHS